MAKSWSPLVAGDIVDVIAPGSSVAPQVLEGAIEFLKSWGFVPRVPEEIFGKDVICATDDATRLRLVKEALLAKDSKAIWCIRGGYGSNRLIPELAKLRKPAGDPKLFIGLSDITSLHVFLNQNWGWPTIHGPLLDRFSKKTVRPEWLREMHDFVFGRMDSIEFADLKPMNAAAKKSGKVTGTVSGGNLITLQSTLGSKASWKTKGQILFFEEIGERGYRVDRVLAQLEQVGAFKVAKAVVFGDFTEGQEPDGSDRTPGILQRFADITKIPVFSGVPCGHDVVQRPVPFGTKAVLTLGKSGKLWIASGVKGPRKTKSTK